MSYWVYMTSNLARTVFYTGVTNDLRRRIFEHQQDESKTTFSSKYRTKYLVWAEEFNDSLSAIEVEKKIKGWSRSKKIKMIRSHNPNLEVMEI